MDDYEAMFAFLAGDEGAATSTTATTIETAAAPTIAEPAAAAVDAVEDAAGGGTSAAAGKALDEALESFAPPLPPYVLDELREGYTSTAPHRDWLLAAVQVTSGAAHDSPRSRTSSTASGSDAAPTPSPLVRLLAYCAEPAVPATGGSSSRSSSAGAPATSSSSSPPPVASALLKGFSQLSRWLRDGSGQATAALVHAAVAASLAAATGDAVTTTMTVTLAALLTPAYAGLLPLLAALMRCEPRGDAAGKRGMKRAIALAAAGAAAGSDGDPKQLPRVLRLTLESMPLLTSAVATDEGGVGVAAVVVVGGGSSDASQDSGSSSGTSSLSTHDAAAAAAGAPVPRTFPSLFVALVWCVVLRPLLAPSAAAAAAASPSSGASSGRRGSSNIVASLLECVSAPLPSPASAAIGGLLLPSLAEAAELARPHDAAAAAASASSAAADGDGYVTLPRGTPLHLDAGQACVHVVRMPSSAAATIALVAVQMCLSPVVTAGVVAGVHQGIKLAAAPSSPAAASSSSSSSSSASSEEASPAQRASALAQLLHVLASFFPLTQCVLLAMERAHSKLVQWCKAQARMATVAAGAADDAAIASAGDGSAAAEPSSRRGKRSSSGSAGGAGAASSSSYYNPSAQAERMAAAREEVKTAALVLCTGVADLAHAVCPLAAPSLRSIVNALGHDAWGRDGAFRGKPVAEAEAPQKQSTLAAFVGSSKSKGATTTTGGILVVDADADDGSRSGGPQYATVERCWSGSYRHALYADKAAAADPATFSVVARLPSSAAVEGAGLPASLHKTSAASPLATVAAFLSGEGVVAKVKEKPRAWESSLAYHPAIADAIAAGGSDKDTALQQYPSLACVRPSDGILVHHADFRDISRCYTRLVTMSMLAPASVPDVAQWCAWDDEAMEVVKRLGPAIHTSSSHDRLAHTLLALVRAPLAVAGDWISAGAAPDMPMSSQGGGGGVASTSADVWRWCCRASRDPTLQSRWMPALAPPPPQPASSSGGAPAVTCLGLLHDGERAHVMELLSTVNLHAKAVPLSSLRVRLDKFVLRCGAGAASLVLSWLSCLEKAPPADAAPRMRFIPEAFIRIVSTDVGKGMVATRPKPQAEMIQAAATGAGAASAAGGGGGGDWMGRAADTSGFGWPAVVFDTATSLRIVAGRRTIDLGCSFGDGEALVQKHLAASPALVSADVGDDASSDDGGDGDGSVGDDDSDEDAGVSMRKLRRRQAAQLRNALRRAAERTTGTSESDSDDDSDDDGQDDDSQPAEEFLNWLPEIAAGRVVMAMYLPCRPHIPLALPSALRVGEDERERFFGWGGAAPYMTPVPTHLLPAVTREKLGIAVLPPGKRDGDLVRPPGRDGKIFDSITKPAVGPKRLPPVHALRPFVAKTVDAELRAGLSAYIPDNLGKLRHGVGAFLNQYGSAAGDGDGKHHDDDASDRDDNSDDESGDAATTAEHGLLLPHRTLQSSRILSLAAAMVLRNHVATVQDAIERRSKAEARRAQSQRTSVQAKAAEDAAAAAMRVEGARAASAGSHTADDAQAAELAALADAEDAASGGSTLRVRTLCPGMLVRIRRTAESDLVVPVVDLRTGADAGAAAHGLEDYYGVIIATAGTPADAGSAAGAASAASAADADACLERVSPSDKAATITVRVFGSTERTVELTPYQQHAHDFVSVALHASPSPAASAMDEASVWSRVHFPLHRLLDKVRTTWPASSGDSSKRVLHHDQARSLHAAEVHTADARGSDAPAGITWSKLLMLSGATLLLSRPATDGEDDEDAVDAPCSCSSASASSSGAGSAASSGLSVKRCLKLLAASARHVQERYRLRDRRATLHQLLAACTLSSTDLAQHLHTHYGDENDFQAVIDCGMWLHSSDSATSSSEATASDAARQRETVRAYLTSCGYRHDDARVRRYIAEEAADATATSAATAAAADEAKTTAAAGSGARMAVEEVDDHGDALPASSSSKSSRVGSRSSSKQSSRRGSEVFDADAGAADHRHAAMTQPDDTGFSSDLPPPLTASAASRGGRKSPARSRAPSSAAESVAANSFSSSGAPASGKRQSSRRSAPPSASRTGAASNAASDDDDSVVLLDTSDDSGHTLVRDDDDDAAGGAASDADADAAAAAPPSKRRKRHSEDDAAASSRTSGRARGGRAASVDSAAGSAAAGAAAAAPAEASAASVSGRKRPRPEPASASRSRASSVGADDAHEAEMPPLTPVERGQKRGAGTASVDGAAAGSGAAPASAKKRGPSKLDAVLTASAPRLRAPAEAAGDAGKPPLKATPSRAKAGSAAGAPGSGRSRHRTLSSDASDDE